jgi:endonuclease/exonuclease/phosphatase family metal-dependent hydrolase
MYSVKILTFNTGLLEVSVGSLSFDVVPRVNERIALLPGALRKTDADIVCLQEIFRLEDMENLRSLSDIYPHMYVSDHKNFLKRNGLCILSKYPFSIEDELMFKTSGIEKFVKKGAVKAIITEGPYAGIEVVNVHFPYGGFGSYSQTLPSTTRKRNKNINHLHQKIHSDTSTTILAGDFNFGPTVSPENFRLIKSLGYEQVSNGDITWDVENPLNLMFPALVSATIDHIFVNKKRDYEFSVIQSERIFDVLIETEEGPVFLSDHFGLLCDIEL